MSFPRTLPPAHCAEQEWRLVFVNHFRGMELASVLSMVLVASPVIAADAQSSRSGPVEAQAGQTFVGATNTGLEISVKPPVGGPTTYVFHTPSAPESAVPSLRENAEVLASSDSVVAIFHETAEAVLVRVDGAAADLGVFVPAGYRLTTFEGGSLITKKPAARLKKLGVGYVADTEAPKAFNQDPGPGDDGGGPGCAKSCSKTCGKGPTATSCSCTAGDGFCCECTCSATSGATCGTSRG